MKDHRDWRIYWIVNVCGDEAGLISFFVKIHKEKDLGGRIRANALFRTERTNFSVS